MARYIGWAVVGIAFFVLSYLVKLETQEPKTLWMSGNELQALHHTKDLVGVRGTVDRVSMKHTGTTVIKLICDDGAPATIIVMPYVSAATPRTGDRIQVSGKLMGSGVITLTNKDQLTFTVPDFAQNKRRASWSGYFINRKYQESGAVTGTVIDEQNHYVGFATVQKQVSLPTEHQPLKLNGYISSDGLTLVVEDAQ